MTDGKVITSRGDHKLGQRLEIREPSRLVNAEIKVARVLVRLVRKY